MNLDGLRLYIFMLLIGLIIPGFLASINWKNVRTLIYYLFAKQARRIYLLLEKKM